MSVATIPLPTTPEAASEWIVRTMTGVPGNGHTVSDLTERALRLTHLADQSYEALRVKRDGAVYYLLYGQE